MKKRKIADKVLLVMGAVMIVGTVGTVRTHASNYHDTYYEEPYYGDGGDVPTGYRQKQDSTSVYIKHLGDVGARVSIRVKGYERNFTWSGDYDPVILGQGCKIANNVWETFRKPTSINLKFSPATHSPCTLYGYWSPDSI